MGERNIRVAVFDIDGTLAMMNKAEGTYTALPGATEVLSACREKGITPVAYTNGTFFPPATYHPLLEDAGIVLDPGHILTPSAVAAQALAAKGYQRVMVLGGDGTTVPVAGAGIEVITPQADAPSVDAVLVGFTKDFGAAQVEAAARAIWDGAELCAGSIAPYFAAQGGRMLGMSGALAAALSHAGGVPIKVYGKPETAGIEVITAMTGASAEEMVVIGDDPKLEILMARRAGAATIGVTTGLADVAAFEAMAADERAELVLSGLPEMLDLDWLKGAA